MGAYQLQQSYSGVAGAGLETDTEYLDVITIEEAASLVRPVTTPPQHLFPLVTLLLFSSIYCTLLQMCPFAEMGTCPFGERSVIKVLSF